MAKKTRQRSIPRIPDRLRTVYTLEPENLSTEIFEVSIADAKIRALSGLTIEQSRIVHCDVSTIEAKGLRLFDITVESSDFGNTDFSNAVVDRAEFEKCRMLGSRFIEAKVADVLFSGCHMNFSLFRMSKVRDCEFDGCFLKDADFYGSDLTGTVFRNCDLRNAEFSSSKLIDADIRGCEINGLRVDVDAVKGLIIDAHQAAYFVHLLKMKVVT